MDGNLMRNKLHLSALKVQAQFMEQEWLSRGDSPLIKYPPYFSGPVGAFRALSFDACLLFVCVRDHPHQKFGEKRHHVRVAVRRKKSIVY
eukprot:1162143-Pelagomonas_calceolata.AAC.12